MHAHEGTCATDLGGNVAGLSCHHYGRLFTGAWYGATDGCSAQSTCDYVTSVRAICYSGISGSTHDTDDGSIVDSCLIDNEG